MLQLNFIDELRICSQVFVACSGGLDSIVLLDVLHKNGVRVTALHCNFGLRGSESDTDALFVKQYCEKQKISYEIKRFETNKFKKSETQSIQQLARDLRYNWFEELIQLNPGALLCTAHHHDDDMEQVMLRLLSSGRILDLGGIAQTRAYIRRPFLHLRKASLFEYAQENELVWREDSSNAEAHYTRNKIRLELIPLLREIDPRYENALTRLAHDVKQLRVEAEHLVDAFLKKENSRFEFFVPDFFWLNQLSIFKELFLERWKNSSVGAGAIDKLIKAEPGKRVDFDDFYVLREKTSFWFGQHSKDEVKRHEIQLSHCDRISDVEFELNHIEIIHNVKGNDKIVIDVLSPGAVLFLPNGKTRKIKQIFNDQQWTHCSRKKAAGVFINGKLVQVVDFIARRKIYLQCENERYLLVLNA